MSFIPYPFQAEAVAEIDRFGGRALLAHDMGLGKSATSLLWLAENRSALPAIVVCPASLKVNWQREALAHFGMRSEVLEGTKPRGPALSGNAPLTIVNYDILRPWMDHLRGLQPGLIIVDEVQNAKNPKAKRTKAIRELCDGVPHVLALSGTPLVNRPAELFPILNVLNREAFPSFWKYAFDHCNPTHGRFGWDWSGTNDLPGLHRKLLRTCMSRRRKADVLHDLPAKRRIVLPIGLPQEGTEEYRRASLDILGWLRDRGRSTVGAKKAEAVVKLGHLKRLAARLKLPAVLEWVDGFLDGGDKLILFAIHKDVVRAIADRYGGRAVSLTGDTAPKDRQRAIDAFNGDDRVRLFVGNVQAAGAGWSATSCSTVAFAELPWTPGEVSQATDRVHGIKRGIEGEISTAYFLVAHGTIEADLCEVIQRKQGTLEATLDGTAGDGTGLDVFDELCRTLEEREAIERREGEPSCK